MEIANISTSITPASLEMANVPSSEDLRVKSATPSKSKDLYPSGSHKEDGYNMADTTGPLSRDDPRLRSNVRQNLFMVFITLTQLVQMIPLGVGINSSLAIGEALDASHIDSVWIVASYPLTQGAFVLIGKYTPTQTLLPLGNHEFEMLKME